MSDEDEAAGKSSDEELRAELAKRIERCRPQSVEDLVNAVLALFDCNDIKCDTCYGHNDAGCPKCFGLLVYDAFMTARKIRPESFEELTALMHLEMVASTRR